MYGANYQRSYESQPATSQYQHGQWGQAPEGTYISPTPNVFRNVQEVLRDLVEYYSGIYLQKIEDKSGSGIYYAKILTFLGNDDRYLIGVVPNDHNPVGTEVTLDQLPFSGIQTRTLSIDHDLTPQQHNKPHRHNLKNYQLEIAKSDMARSDYYCSSSPIDVALIHDIKAKSRYQYPDSIRLDQALETWQCVIRFK